MTDRSGFLVEHCRADAAALHEFAPPETAQATVVVAEVTEPALVLGSSQDVAVVDRDRARSAGIAVIGRRSGGGSVFLAPGGQVWLDFWVPSHHPWWRDDVVAAALPVGELWVHALQAVGVEGVSVHRNGLVETDWSPLVCFAGRGPGEVFDQDSVKWMGLSQRRTRHWIRLQTMVHRRWSAEAALDLLNLSDETRQRAVAELTATVGSVGEADLVAAVLARLPRQ